jgi:hypothetical protein
MQERRREGRTQTYKRAKISLNGSLCDCVVRNISPRGACLELMSTAYIRDEVFLTFDNAPTPRACRVAWRSATEIGVEFR